MLGSKPSIFLVVVALVFAYIENRRGGNRAYLDDWGQSTAQCLIQLQDPDWIRFGRILRESGGIRHPP